MKIIGIIPARYASSRFPGKPLVDINGKPMIVRVYEQALKAKKPDLVVVATDDERIAKVVEEHNGVCIMTSREHKSGTDRCMEVIQKLKKEKQFFDVAINIQGDEPYIQPEQIDLVVEDFEEGDVQIATLAKKKSTKPTICKTAML
jgi:3-deoxy-manno-octulosonate cytidylyltransferase (CMP-KDO synthetase)